MSDEWDMKICCMGAGYVGGPTMAVIAKQCPKVRNSRRAINAGKHIFWCWCALGNKWEATSSGLPYTQQSSLAPIGSSTSNARRWGYDVPILHMGVKSLRAIGNVRAFAMRFRRTHWRRMYMQWMKRSGAAAGQKQMLSKAVSSTYTSRRPDRIWRYDASLLDGDM